MMRDKDDNGPFHFFIITEGILILLFGLFTKYDSTANTDTNGEPYTGLNSNLPYFYPMYQDVHVMVFIGFGFLMTFLRRYGYGAVGLTFFLSSVCIQWTMLCRGFWHNVFHSTWNKIELSVDSLLNADFGAAAVMISFGGVIGKLSPTQLLIMAIIEIIFYTLNEVILIAEVQMTDYGGSVIIHTFGAYFGLAVAWMIGKQSHRTHKDNSSVYHANIFSFIGTLFLWLFWPSFNAAIAGDDANARHRAVVNTLLSISTSSIVAFYASSFLHKRRFEVVDIQNATLAGGVAIGGASGMYTTPWGAMFVGFIAGNISTWGFARLMPYLNKKISLYDTCGIHNLHGMPGIIGGVAAAIFAGIATVERYGTADLISVFPARDTRSATEQAGYQMIGLITAIGISLLSGFAVGFLMRLLPSPKSEFTDESYWLMPEEEIPTYFSESHSNHSLPTHLSTPAKQPSENPTTKESSI